MNLGIIIGVSEYLDPKDNLPACKNDASLLHGILSRTDKFDPILLLDKNQKSAKVKEELTNFITANQGKQINEVFLYYTGHGEFYDGEFYYLLSDYDSSKRKQTTLQNSELDNLLRTLAPGLVIKVIDACQSGTSYIKEPGVITKYFDSTKSTFKKCYFMYSSLNSQSSFAGEDISAFTNSFLESLKEHTTDEIRYKDIMDYVSDAFEGVKEQTPYFVIQAEYTEKFTVINNPLKNFLSQTNFTKGTEDDKDAGAPTLLDLITMDAKEYGTKEETVALLDELGREAKNVKLIQPYNNIFDVTTTLLDEYKSIPNSKAIGNWISNNQNGFFAKATYHTVYEESASLWGTQFITTASGLRDAGRVAKIARDEIDGFELKVDVPYKGIFVRATSKYPNVNSYCLTVAFLISKKAIRFFYNVTDYIEESWDVKKINFKGIEWRTVEFKITDKASVLAGFQNIIVEFNERLDKDLNEKFKLGNSSQT